MSEFSYWEIWEESIRYQLVEEGYSEEEAIEKADRLVEEMKAKSLLREGRP